MSKTSRLAIPAAATILTFSALGMCGATAAQARPPVDGEGGGGISDPTPAPAPAPAPLPGVGPYTLPLPAPVPVPVPADLVTSSEQKVTESGARRMKTDATFFPLTGTVVAATRTWNSVKLTGFHGGVTIFFLNAQGRILGSTSTHVFGVDGTWIGDEDRTDIWSESVTAPWIGEATQIVAVHSHEESTQFVDYIKAKVGEAFDQLWEWFMSIIPKKDG